MYHSVMKRMITPVSHCCSSQSFIRRGISRWNKILSGVLASVSKLIPCDKNGTADNRVEQTCGDFISLSFFAWLGMAKSVGPPLWTRLKYTKFGKKKNSHTASLNLLSFFKHSVLTHVSLIPPPVCSDWSFSTYI